MNSINLVTGGAGFIGSHLVDKLLDNGENVICLDNFSTGNEKNLEHLKFNKNLQIVKQDILDPFYENIDKIWHLACPASPKKYQIDPIKTLQTCFIGTNNILNLAKKSKAKILLASSSEIYGDPLIHPQTEDFKGYSSTTSKRACYIEGKRISETLFSEFQNMYDVDIRIVRLFNTYGPRMLQDDGRVVSNFIAQALANKKITIYGDGSQTRSLCYVSDIIKGLILVMNNNYKKPLNLGSPNEFSISKLANIIKSKVNSNLEFEYLKLPEDDPKKRRPEIKLIKKILNWEPIVNIEEGLDLTIEYFKNKKV